MAKPAFYKIIDRPDGLFDIEVRLGDGETHVRPGFASLSEVDLALDDLRALMAACSMPLILGEELELIAELPMIHPTA